MLGESENVFKKLEFLKDVELKKPEFSKEEMIINAKRMIETKEDKRDAKFMNKKRILKSFNTGDLIYFLNPNVKSKMDPVYLGPRKILKKLSDYTYLIEGFNRPLNVRRLIRAGFNREIQTQKREEIMETNDKKGNNIKFDTIYTEVSPSIQITPMDTTSEEEYISADEEIETDDSDEDDTQEIKKELISKLYEFEKGNLRRSEFEDIINFYVRSGRSLLHLLIEKKKFKDILKWIEESSEENFKM